MKFISLIILSMCICSTTSYAQTGYTLKIDINKIKELKGTIFTCLVYDQTEYLGNCENGQKTAVTSKEQTVTFTGLAAGTYCVTIFHDEDDNGKLNTKGLFGKPSEPYGFSNNPSSMFGPPKYRKCTFDLSGDKTISVKL